MRRAVLASAALFAVLTACESSMSLGQGGVDGGAADVDANGSSGNTPDGSAVPANPAFPPTCAGLCDKLIACGFTAEDKRASCLGECNARGAPRDVLDCMTTAACERIEPECLRGLDGETPSDFLVVEDCRGGCDVGAFYQCRSAADLSECRSLCLTASTERRTTFAACARNASSACKMHTDCLAELRKP